MAAKREVPNADDLIRAYIAGEPMRQRLKQAAVSDCLFNRLLRDAGVKRRSFKDSRAAMRSRPKPGPRHTPERMPELLAEYAVGTSEKALAAKIGVTRGTMRALLIRHGARIRGRSEAETVKWAAMKHDRAAVERQCAAAWRAADARDETMEKAAVALYRTTNFGAGVIADAIGTTRGNVKRLVMKNGGADRPAERRASGMQFAAGSAMISRYELPLLVALRAEGLYPVHQYAVGACNVDFAFPELRVAVEVERRPLCDSKSLTSERCKYLFDRGWKILVVLDGKRRGINYPSVAKKIVANLDVLRGDPPTACKYGVISRDGKTSTRTGQHLYGWPRIAGL